MKRTMMTFAAGIACCAVAGADLPQLSVQDWTGSLAITDYEGNAAALDYACVIDSKVDGSVPAHDASYDDWIMDFVVRFDRAVKKNDVTFYGQIRSDNGAWSTINSALSEQKNNCWHPLQIPAKAANAETRLLQMMLASDEWDCTIRYNNGINNSATAIAAGISALFGSTTYKLNFTKLIETFYCGIAFRSSEYLGTTCTIDVVLINPSNSSDRRTLSTITYRYDRGMYKDDSPGKWFNAKVGWWEQLPRDYSRCVNCEVSEDEEGSFSMKGLGRVDFDGEASFQILTNKWARRTIYRKKLEVEVEGGKSLTVQTFEETAADYEPSYFLNTASCALYAEDGATNLMAFVKKTGENVNEYRKLVPEKPLDLSERVRFTISVIKRLDGTFAEYQVNGTRCLLEGEATFPVAMTAEENRLGMRGNAVVTDVYGDLEREPHGKAIIFQ